MMTHPTNRFVASLDETGRVVFTTFKAWHIGRGYRSWRTLEEAHAYAERTHDVARIDQIVTTIVWQKEND